MPKDTHLNVKEKALEVGVSEVTKKIIEYILLLAIPLIAGLVPQVRDRILAVLSPGQIAGLLGISIALNLASVSYLLHLRRSHRSALTPKKMIPRFGILWDEGANPFCPSCKTLMQLRGTGLEEKLKCSPCITSFTLKTDTGSHVRLIEAKTVILTGNPLLPASDDI